MPVGLELQGQVYKLLPNLQDSQAIDTGNFLHKSTKFLKQALRCLSLEGRCLLFAMSEIMLQVSFPVLESSRAWIQVSTADGRYSPNMLLIKITLLKCWSVDQLPACYGLPKRHRPLRGPAEQSEEAGVTEVGLPRRTTLTPFSCKPCRMLSVAALVSAQASTGPTPCSAPVSTFTMRLRIWSSASSVLVFPVPGGPCAENSLPLEFPLCVQARLHPFTVLTIHLKFWRWASCQAESKWRLNSHELFLASMRSIRATDKIATASHFASKLCSALRQEWSPCLPQGASLAEGEGNGLDLAVV